MKIADKITIRGNKAHGIIQVSMMCSDNYSAEVILGKLQDSKEWRISWSFNDRCSFTHAKEFSAVLKKGLEIMKDLK